MEYRSKQRILNRESQMAEKYFNRKSLTSLVIMGIQSKLLWDSILHLSEWLRSITQVTTHAGFVVEHGKTPLLLVGVQTCTVIMNINMEFPQKVGNWFTSRTSFTTLGNTPKVCSIQPQGHLVMFIEISSIIVRN